MLLEWKIVPKDTAIIFPETRQLNHVHITGAGLNEDRIEQIPMNRARFSERQLPDVPERRASRRPWSVGVQTPPWTWNDLGSLTSHQTASEKSIDIHHRILNHTPTRITLPMRSNVETDRRSEAWVKILVRVAGCCIRPWASRRTSNRMSARFWCVPDWSGDDGFAVKIWGDSLSTTGDGLSGEKVVREIRE